MRHHRAITRPLTEVINGGADGSLLARIAIGTLDADRRCHIVPGAILDPLEAPQVD